MIYLILDTNIWVYLANGMDSDDKIVNDHHFDLLKSLEDLQNSGDICILVNEIIYGEWKRNKENARIRIQRLKHRLQTRNSVFGEIKKYVKTDLSSIEAEYAENLEASIKANEVHLEKVEKFLLHKCKKVDVSQRVINRIFELSTQNLAPFHNKSNNNADASILLSSAEFLQNSIWGYDLVAIFVSNNFNDFTDGKDKDNFHPHILKELNGLPLRYARYLPKALKFSQEIIEELEELFLQDEELEAWQDSVNFACNASFCGGNETVYLDKFLVMKDPNSINPNQLKLFGDDYVIKGPTLRSGKCSICNTFHFDCPKCDSILCLEDESTSVECFYCGTIMQKYFDPFKNEDYVFVLPDLHEQAC